MTIKATATRVSKASKDSVWKAMEDLENYPRWADSTRKTRMVSCKIVSREGNTVVCDCDELVGGRRAKHTERVTVYPKEKCDSEFITGGPARNYLLELYRDSARHAHRHELRC